MINDQQNIIEHLSSHLFWDVDKSQLEAHRSSQFIIHRVLEYGLLNDWNEIKKYYGLPYIKSVALELKNLDEVTLAFLCTLFDLKKNDFRCYRHRQSTRHFWNY